MPNISAINLASYPKIDAATNTNKIMIHDNYNNIIKLIKCELSLMLQGGKVNSNLDWDYFTFPNATLVNLIGHRKLDIVYQQIIEFLFH